MSRIKFTLLLLSAALLAACGPQADSQSPAPPEVEVAHPEIRSITNWDEYTGRLAAVDAVEVRARVSGYLQSVHFEDGQQVQVGDLLFVIDPRPYEAVVERARADVQSARVALEQAERNFTRAKDLLGSNSISQESYETRAESQSHAAAQLSSVQATLRAAELELEFTRIVAPVAGRISRKLVSEGNLVSGGSTGATLLTVIVSQDPMYIYFTADERSYLKYVRLDQQGSRPSSRVAPNPVRIQLADETGFPHEGHMDFVDTQIDEATGTLQGRAVLPNPDNVLLPGMFARVQLLGEGPFDAVLVPDTAIGTDQSRRFVFVVNADNVAELRVVEPGRLLEDGMRIITAGLKASDRIIVAGLQRVRSGQPVTVAQD
jgi:RND family efflux transporter MFP subunit